MKTTHVGLVRTSGNMITAVRYMESKWERELGDVLTIEGISFKVAFIGVNRGDVITQLNEVIEEQNKLVRLANKEAKANFLYNLRQQKISSSDKFLFELLMTLNNYKF